MIDFKKNILLQYYDGNKKMPYIEFAYYNYVGVIYLN